MNEWLPHLCNPQLKSQQLQDLKGAMLPSIKKTLNKMKQNDDKTEFLIIGTPGQLKKGNFRDIHICEAEVSVSEQACKLGIIFDKEMNSKINNISKTGYNHVRNLAAIRNTLE